MQDNDYDVSVIIPTFQEKDNIAETIHKASAQLFSNFIRGEIIVVDDNSPDGTARVAEATRAARVIIRTSDKGLSQSVVEGFSQAHSNIFIVIDADGSHPVEMIPKLWQAIMKGNDIAIGSRYMKNGGIESWSFKRRVVSFGATLLGRLMFPHITDPVSGIFAIKSDVIHSVSLRPRGYKILVEILGKGNYSKVTEIPFTFTDRKKGSSKLSLTQIREYASQLIDIAANAAMSRRGVVWDEFTRILKFGVVGASGIVINLWMLYTLIEIFSVSPMVAVVFSIETSIITNFILNDLWTFKKMHNSTFIRRVCSFHVISAVGAIVNIAIFAMLTYVGIWYILAEVVGILCAFALNFILNRFYTWK
jgi:dolichol-phosphate mannosyltransferase